MDQRKSYEEVVADPEHRVGHVDVAAERAAEKLVPEVSGLRKLPMPTTTSKLADHVLIDHEKEVVGVNGRELKAIHVSLHKTADHWDHTHGRKG